MKKTSILLAALSFAALASCSKVENAEPAQDAPKTIHVTLTADAPDAPAEEGATKVGIEGDRNTGFRTFWEEGDEVLLVLDGQTGNKSVELKLTSIDNEGKATFQGDISEVFYKNKTYTLVVTCNWSNTGEVPSSQTMNGSSFDKRAAIMVSKPVGKWITDSGKNSLTLEGFKFAHVCTFLNIYVKEISAKNVSGDEAVKSVTVTVPDKLIAGLHDYSTNKVFKGSTDLVMTPNYAVNTITVKVPEGTKLKDLSAMVVAAPFELKDEQLTIAIDTEKHSMKKTVNLTRNFSKAKMTSIGFVIDNTFDVAPYIKVKQSDLTFSYLGETRSFDIDANVSWSVDTESLPEGATVEKIGDVLKVTLPISSHFGDKKFPVKLVGTGASATINFVQPSLWEVNGGCKVNADGSLLVGVGSTTPELTLKQKTKYYNLDFIIKDGKNFGSNSPTATIVRIKLDYRHPNAGMKSYEHIFGGEQGTGNGLFENGILLNNGGFTKNMVSSDFNMLSSLSVSLKGYSTYNTCTFGHADLTDGSSFGRQVYTGSFPTWNACDKGVITFRLEGRGSGSFVISSYKAQIKDLNK